MRSYFFHIVGVALSVGWWVLGATLPTTQSIGSPGGNWGLDRVDQRKGTDGAYSYFADGSGVHIYVIDTGVLTAHEDFTDASGNSRATYVGDFCDATAREGAPRTTSAETYADGYDGHGTHVASYAAGRLSGVAKNARILALRAQGADGPDCGEHRNGPATAWAVKWITAHGQRPGIVNISFGGGNAEVQEAIRDSIDAGFVYTLSGGTGGAVDKRWGPLLPDEALVVGGTDRRDRPLGRDYGPRLALFAPAEGLVGAGRASTDDYSIPEHCCGNAAGDSFAAPFVAGAVAKYLQMHPDASPDAVRAALLEMATTIEHLPEPLLYSPPFFQKRG